MHTEVALEDDDTLRIVQVDKHKTHKAEIKLTQWQAKVLRATLELEKYL